MSSAPESARNNTQKFLSAPFRRGARAWGAICALMLFGAAGCAAIQNPAVTEPSAALSSDAGANPDSLLKSARGPMPLYFIENRGQVDPRAAYYLRGKDKTLYFTAEGITFILNRARREGAETMRVRTALESGGVERWVLKLDFVGAHRVAPRGEEPTPAVVSYFKGPKDEWKTGLKTYAKLVYADLWPGIDLVYDGSAERIKYMFVVKPGADPKQIQLAYRGASSLRINERQELEIATPVGDFHDDRPHAYQEIAGRHVEVPMSYRVQSDQARYGFHVGKYDRKQPLVLDPAIIIYSGFIGGLLDDKANGIAVDSAGAAYVTGETSSDATTFPDTSGAFERTQNGGVDAFVAKVKADGTGLIYAGFIGGDGDDRGLAIALAPGCAPPCEAYVTGETNSDTTPSATKFPVTTGAFDETFNLNIDAFVARVKDDGTDLLYVTYIGGSGTDRGKGIVVDTAGEAYVTGETNSSEATFPGNAGGLAALVIPGPDQTHNLGFDAFVVKVNAGGSALIYATYIGGSGDDRGNAIAIEPGCPSPCAAYVAGETSSTATTFPVTSGSFDETLNGGIDAFVAKVKDDGTDLLYASYLGGSSTDRANGIAADGLGNAYVAGETNSDEDTFPDGGGFVALGIPGPDQTHNGGVDAFVAKVNPGGSALIYAGYIGGSGDDRANAIALDPGCAPPCEAYVAGETSSDQLTFPKKVGPDLTFNGGVDAFFAKVKDDGSELLIAGYIGGDGDERGNAIAADTTGAAYVAGETSSTTISPAVNKFPVRTGPDKTQNGAVDAFVTKLCTTGCVDLILKMTGAPKAVLPGPGPGSTITYTLTVTNKGPDDATNVVLDDPVPAGAGFISAIPSVGGCNAVVHCTLGPLAKGAPAITVVIQFSAPALISPVANTATVAADETDTSAGNNSVTVKTTVTLPDLLVKKITLDVSTVPPGGGPVNVTDTTSNRQGVSAGASTTSFYLSATKTLSGGEPLLNSRAIPALGPKGSDTALVPTTVAIPASLVGTIWYIIAVADDGGAVVELDETNNARASKKITVQ